MYLHVASNIIKGILSKPMHYNIEKSEMHVFFVLNRQIVPTVNQRLEQVDSRMSPISLYVKQNETARSNAL